MEQNKDGMYYSRLPNGVRPDEEGFYRWTYEVDSSANTSMLKTYLLIFALIILIPGAGLFFMIFVNKGYFSGAGTFLLIWLAILAGVELLTYLIYKGIEKVKGGVTTIPYLMGNDFIIVHPGNKLTPRYYLQTDFSAVKSIKPDLKNDLILLNEIARVTHVYAEPEDMPFVLNFILDRVPQTDQIKKLRQQAKELTGSK